MVMGSRDPCTHSRALDLHAKRTSDRNKARPLKPCSARLIMTRSPGSKVGTIESPSIGKHFHILLGGPQLAMQKVNGHPPCGADTINHLTVHDHFCSDATMACATIGIDLNHLAW